MAGWGDKSASNRSMPARSGIRSASAHCGRDTSTGAEDCLDVVGAFADGGAVLFGAHRRQPNLYLARRLFGAIDL